MMKNIMTFNDLFSQMAARSLANPEEIELIRSRLMDNKDQISDPIYIRIVTGIGAWFAAIFLIAFLGVSGIIDNETGAIICGILFLAAAIFVSRNRRSTFLAQLSLAMAFSGNILVIFGTAAKLGHADLSVLVITHAVICLVMYPLYASNIYRFLAPIALVVLITAWIVEKNLFSLIHLLVACEMGVAGTLIFYKKLPTSLKPLLYSASVMLPATLFFLNLTQIDVWRENFTEPLWPSSLLLTGGLLMLYVHLSQGLRQFREPLMMLVVAATILLGVFTTPGILVAIGLLVVGYAYDDRILSWLAYLFLPGFLVVFYYALNIDLAHKSWMIGGSGLLLLIVRQASDHLASREAGI